jgi:hypothetical protein
VTISPHMVSKALVSKALGQAPSPSHRGKFRAAGFIGMLCT